ncbi:MAG TPA: AAA family ATPase [Candidatus Eremiobacteraceae bacterium]|nr:AAA family ATPase [Candidatus Eremiobacteraceae bacterium]
MNADGASEALAKFKVPAELLENAGVRHLTDIQVRELLGVHGRAGQDLSGVVFPYRDPRDGRTLSYRVRLDVSLDGQKYLSAQGCRTLFFSPMQGKELTDTSIPVVIVEAEKSALALSALASRHGRKQLVVATGGVWGWKRKTGTELQPDGTRRSVSGPSRSLDWIVWKDRRVIIVFDSNVVGRPDLERARRDFAAELFRRGAHVLIASVPRRNGVNGPDDLIAVVGDGAAFEMLGRAAPFAHEKTVPLSTNPWEQAENLEHFLASGEDGVDFLDSEKRILARAAITEIFSPRGLGKSVYALWLALRLAQRFRVLYIDRDNPRHVVRSRLRSFGAETAKAGLKVISREKCPPLTNSDAWALFPYADYDVVILDSFDSAAEGVGEQDSARPSRAIALILDIARRENGPAVLILGNTIRSAAHSRGSGVVEDRADIVYEVRDATELHPSGSKPWLEELPPADAGAWISRSSRRKQRTKFRLAFVASKFRLSQEPEPFIIEIDLSAEPWTVRDVTGEVDREGTETRAQRVLEHTEKIAEARAALAAEILRRDSAGEPPMLKDRDAIPFLMGAPHGLKRADARDIVNTPEGRWVLSQIEGQKGHPVGLLAPGKNESGGGNTPVTEGAEIEARNDADFRQPDKQGTAEIDPSNTPTNRVFRSLHISAEAPTPPLPFDGDDEVRL